MDAGFYGLLDFTGTPVGIPYQGPGFYGLLDFTGIPVGVPVPSKVKGKGKAVGGRHLYYAQIMAMAQQRRRQVDINRDLAKEVLRRSLIHAYVEHEQQQAVAVATYSVLLAEL